MFEQAAQRTRRHSQLSLRFLSVNVCSERWLFAALKVPRPKDDYPGPSSLVIWNALCETLLQCPRRLADTEADSEPAYASIIP